ncbi:lipoyl synthase [Candidatus Micrarchaeota archaeon]|nr:lipoyl synthase [Candidatus Micrarchaeota archaeon]
MKIRPGKAEFCRTTRTIRSNRITTVCEEAKCPNLSECWSCGTATFMVLGDTCTRGCRFCSVKTAAKGREVDVDEPKKIAEAAREMGLKYVVITSVDRDDLPDHGAKHFAECVKEVKAIGAKVEVLAPDFRGDLALVQKVLDAKPDVFGHNIETVRRLQKKARDPRASYGQSLKVLGYAKGQGAKTKSAIMLGLGETTEEVLEAMDDLRTIGCDFLAIGQYLQPSPLQLPVEEYVKPETFGWLKGKALEKGFRYCAAGPFVRSSYRAAESSGVE